MRTKKYGSKDLEKRLGKATIGEFIRTWRISEGMTLKGFGKKIGISVANLCDIEKGRKGVSPEKAHEIGLAIGVRPALLVKMAVEEQLAVADLSYAVELEPVA